MRIQCLFILSFTFLSCTNTKELTTEIKGTEIYFTRGNIYASEVWLSTRAKKTISKGIYIDFVIKDSTKLVHKFEITEERDIYVSQGDNIVIKTISKEKTDSTMHKLMLSANAIPH